MSDPALDAPGSVMSSTGTLISRSSDLAMPASTISTFRFGPTRNRPTRSSGRWVADRPMRCTWRGSSPASSRALAT